MENFLIMPLGLLLIGVGVAMLGMRAGYWLFVLSFKTVIMVALIAMAFLWYVGIAHAEGWSYFHR
jgi:predicted tellurium resistance membrane protein TerC